jgi:hypothetical protein
MFSPILKPTWHEIAVIHKYHLQKSEHHTAVYNLSILQIEVKCYRADSFIICDVNPRAQLWVDQLDHRLWLTMHGRHADADRR